MGGDSLAGKVTAGLTESNRRLLLDGWLSHLRADCLYTWISSGPNVRNEYGRTLFLPHSRVNDLYCDLSDRLLTIYCYLCFVSVYPGMFLLLFMGLVAKCLELMNYWAHSMVS